jgi:amino acid permease
MNKRFWAASFTLSGMIIGAGILGLPYIFAKSGFIIGLFWIIILGAVLTYTNLCLGEVTLRTKSHHQLSGYAEVYLGKGTKRVMFFAMIFGVYSALLAYLIGEGESLAKIIPGNINPLVLGVAFWLIMTLILREGLRGIKKVETWGVLAIIALILGIFMKFLPQISMANLSYTNSEYIGLPIGIVFFALMGFTAIPELRVEIKGQEKLLKKAILVGSIIPIILYIIFTLTFVGVLGSNVSEVATLSFGPIVTLLGVFTMTTAFIATSYALKDSLRTDLKLSKGKTFFFASIIPLILYILAWIWPEFGFSRVLGIGGIVSGGLTGIVILLVNKKAKKVDKSKKQPEINMPINWKIIILLTAIFIGGMIAELM